MPNNYHILFIKMAEAGDEIGDLLSEEDIVELDEIRKLKRIVSEIRDEKMIYTSST